MYIFFSLVILFLSILIGHVIRLRLNLKLLYSIIKIKTNQISLKPRLQKAWFEFLNLFLCNVTFANPLETSENRQVFSGVIEH